MIAAGGNWRSLKEAGTPSDGGRYLVLVSFGGFPPIYAVSRWDGAHWDLLGEQITHWAPLYGLEGEPV